MSMACPTGGKSNTLAKIFTELFNENKTNLCFKKNSHFVVIDFNGEYVKDEMITKEKTVFNLTTRNSSGEKYKIKQTNIKLSYI